MGSCGAKFSLVLFNVVEALYFVVGELTLVSEAVFFGTEVKIVVNFGGAAAAVQLSMVVSTLLGVVGRLALTLCDFEHLKVQVLTAIWTSVKKIILIVLLGLVGWFLNHSSLLLTFIRGGCDFFFRLMLLGERAFKGEDFLPFGLLQRVDLIHVGDRLIFHCLFLVHQEGKGRVALSHNAVNKLESR